MNSNGSNDSPPVSDPIASTSYSLPHADLAPLPPADIINTNEAIPAESSINKSNKRPLPARTTKGTKQNGDQISEKKLRRLEKNRLSARECRRRKREATENMQRQINVLEGENLRLRLQLQVGYSLELLDLCVKVKLVPHLNFDIGFVLLTICGFLSVFNLVTETNRLERKLKLPTKKNKRR